MRPPTTVVHVREVDWYQDRPDLLPFAGTVYIGRAVRGTFRASYWANPLRLRKGATDAERLVCLEQYEAWLRGQPELMQRLPTLRGKRLACWCAPKACHGDVLARLADAEARP